MAFKPIKDYLPELYFQFLPEIFSKEIPAEIFTDCQNCHMLCNSRSDLGSEASRPFAPDTKCCTFIPQFSNYLAGAVFADNDPSLDEGRKKLRETIKSRKGIFPHGIYPTKKYSILYELGKAEGFGKSLTLKCPYFLEGKFNCGLWKYREAVCATWFCKHLAQQSGHLFWNSVTKCLKYIEECLIAYILKKEKLPVIHPYGENKNISYEDLDELPLKNDEYSYRWGIWEGKEEEFYIRSYQYFISLTNEDFLNLMGINFQILLDEVQEKYDALMEIPEIMLADPSHVLPEIKNGTYRIELKTWIERNDSYITHAIDFPSVVIDTFDGELSTTKVLEIIEKNYGIIVGKDILIALYQHGILVKK